MLKPEILEKLRTVTPEEEEILGGQKTIDRSIYMQDRSNTINSKKLLESGKQISMRKHTRFIDFPEHTHDYVELIYMCSGQTTHFVDGKKITLNQGELLFLGQSAKHRVLRAGEEDIAVNFIILPHFFSDSLSVVGEDDTPLKRFLIDCLFDSQKSSNCLYYKVSEITEIQNLLENLLLIVTGNAPNKRKQSQLIMQLIFMQLLSNTERLVAETKEQEAVFKLLDYIETNYKNGSLKEAAKEFHYDVSWLSREVLRKTGKTFTELMQEKRLSQAAFLLKNTTAKVSDISVAVGYENASYFHRIFAAKFKTSPREYRIREK